MSRIRRPGRPSTGSALSPAERKRLSRTRSVDSLASANVTKNIIFYQITHETGDNDPVGESAEVIQIADFKGNLKVEKTDDSVLGAPAHAGAFLGKSTKYADPPPQCEVVEDHKPAYDQAAADLERWMLKHLARRLLMVLDDRERRGRVPYSEIAFLPDLEPVPRRVAYVRDRYKIEPILQLVGGTAVPEMRRAPRFRTVNCCRDTIGKGVNPEVWQDERRATLHKVAICASVWVCPICSRRINLQRQVQIRTAYDLFVSKAPEYTDLVTRQVHRWADAVMVTFTVRHGAGDDLADLFDKLKEADRSYLQKSHAYRQIVGYTKHRKGGKRIHVPSTLPRWAMSGASPHPKSPTANTAGTLTPTSFGSSTSA